MKINVTATFQIEYEIDDETALAAFGTSVPAEIAEKEKENLEDGGDYFISMLEGGDGSTMVHEHYGVAVYPGT